MIDWGPTIAIGLVGYWVGLLLHVGYDMNRDWGERGWSAHRIVLWPVFIPQELFCMGRWLWRVWIEAWKDALDK